LVSGFSTRSISKLHKEKQLEFSDSRECELEQWVRCEIVASQREQEPLNTEAEETTLLRAVTYQRLVSAS
jgi:hypothetical protein